MSGRASHVAWRFIPAPGLPPRWGEEEWICAIATLPQDTELSIMLRWGMYATPQDLRDEAVMSKVDPKSELKVSHRDSAWRPCTLYPWNVVNTPVNRRARNTDAFLSGLPRCTARAASDAAITRPKLRLTLKPSFSARFGTEDSNWNMSAIVHAMLPSKCAVRDHGCILPDHVSCYCAAGSFCD